MDNLILLRGGGDLASGVALRLHRAGLRLLITEVAQPLAVRRLVSFSEAVYEGQWQVEDVWAEKISAIEQIGHAFKENRIPIIVDPGARVLQKITPLVLVDARMNKQTDPFDISQVPLVIRLGPGSVPGTNCHAAIETMRGHTLGRVLWHTSPLPNTGIPDPVGAYREARVLRAPAKGILKTTAKIGAPLAAGQQIGFVNEIEITAPFAGILRGLLRDGLSVSPGLKIGDIDPRGHSKNAQTVSDKSLAMGGAVLEAILTIQSVRQQLWS